jgi:hypothetical protein
MAKPKQRRTTPRASAPEQRRFIIRHCKGNETKANARYQADAVKMAERGLFPTSQSWAPGHWSAGQFIVALLLCLIIIGILVFIYMLVVKPEGTLTVTYERRAALAQEKTCPRCAEQIKAAALVCHYCGYEFGEPAVTARGTKST